jgi:carboxyl-terminal processing protease
LTFQKNTVQELDDALVELKMQGLKVLILDLRGNRGGLLAPAIQVAERFLAKGKTIVSTQSGVPDQNRLFKANYPDALVIPLVVLVDGETASAAEVVAAALKDNVRATLVGQTTYGKWSIQRVLQLETSGSGVRITLAKLVSPLHEKYNFNGIKPDLAVDQGDQQLEAAIQQAISLAFMRQ